jgi:hypothetical protein
VTDHGFFESGSSLYVLLEKKQLLLIAMKLECAEDGAHNKGVRERVCKWVESVECG